MDVNFFGTLHCVRSVLPLFEQTGGGRIVNLCSLAGLMGVFGYTAYCASKHAVAGLTHTLRTELKPRNIRVHLVCPPEFDSPMVDEINRDRTPENRRIAGTLPKLTAGEVADAILDGMAKERYEIVPGRTARMAVRLDRWAPSLGRMLSDRLLRGCYQGPGKQAGT
jgi:3-dehydrosphinganine reductase